jgi:hypothetical protein
MTNCLYLIPAILFGILGAVQCVRWGIAGAAWRAYVFSFLPAAAFFAAYILSRKWRRKTFHAAAISLCVLVAGVWGCATVAIESFIRATAEVTNVKKYEKILDTYWGPDSKLIRHFPRPIPANAKAVRFSFLPAFWQGGAHIQLRCSLPSEQVEERYAYFAQKRTKSFFGGMATTSSYTGDTEDGLFPDDYEIMIFDEVRTEDWNHGHSHGVAISKKRHEIVYWAETW